MTALLVIAVFGGFTLSVLFGLWLVPFLRRKKMGQQIREEGPNWHKTKAGTPMMGGLMFIFAVLVLTLGYSIYTGGQNIKEVLCVLFLALTSALVGFLDDYEKLMKKQNLGLTVRQKLVLQAIVAVVFLLILNWLDIYKGEVILPFINMELNVPLWLVYPIAGLVVIFTVNAANLTDGIDGLATGVTLPVMGFFAAAAVFVGKGGIAMLAAGMAGSLAGFLIYNYNPAKVFMGDTGSMFIGGMVTGLAFVMKLPMILVVVGLFYYVESISVVLQVIYFKLTHGKRLFRMSPIHHHFEMCGWSEKKIFYVFTLLTLGLCALSVWGVTGCL